MYVQVSSQIIIAEGLVQFRLVHVRFIAGRGTWVDFSLSSLAFPCHHFTSTPSPHSTTCCSYQKKQPGSLPKRNDVSEIREYWRETYFCFFFSLHHVKVIMKRTMEERVILLIAHKYNTRKFFRKHCILKRISIINHKPQIYLNVNPILCI